VAQAYGWPVELADAGILERLVALNRERAAEEAKGHIRWLRSEYQAPAPEPDASAEPKAKSIQKRRKTEE
jgi:hypothetical protein